ncbi:MAG: hypothetical protein C0602_07505 [Denitrovibrio sp.]|nr:MAG: hypothetical protein C0602_07505 [Denitrovibrio sp.]
MNLSKEDYEARELYANFGLAIYLSQVLELSINNLMVYAFLDSDKENIQTQEEWKRLGDDLYSANYKKTLGKLITELKRSKISLPAEIEERLDEALSIRNFLSHHFFRKNCLSTLSSSGTNKLIIELQNYQKIFTNADKLLDNIFTPLANNLGITNTVIDQKLNEFKESAKRRQF